MVKRQTGPASALAEQMCCRQSSSVFFLHWCEYLSCLARRFNQWGKMNWSFELPGVLVAPRHAAPSPDETVLLASPQRPAGCSHVSACLSVNNCRSLPSSFFLTPTPTLFSVICSSSRSHWQFHPFLLHFAERVFPFSSLGRPLRSAPSISHSHGDPAARMTGTDEKRCTISVS